MLKCTEFKKAEVLSVRTAEKQTNVFFIFIFFSFLLDKLAIGKDPHSSRGLRLSFFSEPGISQHVSVIVQHFSIVLAEII